MGGRQYFFYDRIALAFETLKLRLNTAELFVEENNEMGKRISVIQESDSGRNERFRDNHTNTEMTRSQFVREIEKGNYDNYHIREIDGVETPVSNPDGSERNNLG
ncbi:MAG: hypothetical protein ABR530_08465 [Pyrinomonadaceae bacterium]